MMKTWCYIRILLLICASLAGLFCLPVMAETDNIPEHIPTNFKLPSRPFLMASPDEIPQIREKIRTQDWAGKAAREIAQNADKIIQSPILFPAREGGWPHHYVCLKSGIELSYDYLKPHAHYCPSCKTDHTGAALDDAWCSLTMDRAVAEQETLAVAYIATGDKKYALAMKSAFLDMADKYSRYRIHDRSMTRFDDKAEPIAGRARSQSIEECDVLTALCPSYDMLAGSGVLSREEQDRIEAKIWKPGLAYMYRIMELHPSGGNWWIWHACGAITLGVAFGDQKLVDIGLNTPKLGILSMFRAGYVNKDGFTGELSPGYHAYPFVALVRMASATRRVGIDFYKLPRFKRMFDLPLKIINPDMNMPRLNDGGQSSLFKSPWGDIYEIASNWYPDEVYGQLLHAIYHNPSSKKVRISPQALLYGRSVLPETPLDFSRSSFLKDSGLLILRTPFQDWAVALKNDFGVSGHRHPDAMNMILYANGAEAFPGTGSPRYGNSAYLQWYSQTIAHNTVALNTRSQSISPNGKAVEIALSQWGMGAAQSSAREQQGKLPENESPALLRRTLVMTPHAIVDIFRVGMDTAKARKIKEPFPVNTIDWTLHLNGSLSLPASARKSDDALISPERLDARQGPGQHWPHQGYKYIKDLHELPLAKTYHGTLEQTSGGKIDFWLAPSTAPDKTYQAAGVGLEHSVDECMPMILQRRQSNETSFLSVYSPHRGESPVTAVQFMQPGNTAKDSAVEVKHREGRDIVLSLPEAGTLEAFAARLQGTLGCRSEMGSGNALLLLVGKSWEDGELKILLNSESCLVLERKGKLMRIHNASGMETAKGEIQLVSENVRGTFIVRPTTSEEIKLP